MNKQRYCTNLTFNNKKFLIYIKINSHTDADTEYHYDLELQTTEKISGHEFQKLRKYIESEGYVDEAIKYYYTKH
jgi:hypothetical protein